MNRIQTSVPLMAWVLAALCVTACSTPSPSPQPTPERPTQNPQGSGVPLTAAPTQLGEVPTDEAGSPQPTTVSASATVGVDASATVETTAAPTVLPTPTATVEAIADGQLTITHGPISGEITDTTVVLWARAGMAGTMRFSVTANRAGAQPLVTTALVDGITDYTGKMRFENLDPATLYSYSVTLEVDGQSSPPAIGRFTTAPRPESAAAFEFVIGADIGGQGYCRDSQNGYRIFNAMLAERPAFYLMVGDGVYVDTACEGDNNIAGSEGPFRTLSGFRNRYKYTIGDPFYAEFLAQTPAIPTWDDHEVVNDFGGPQLMAINPELFLEGRQAFFEFWPILGPTDDPFRIYRSFAYGAHADFFVLDTRSYRDPNVNFDPNPVTLTPKTMLGAAQKQWLKDGLSGSDATWKFIVTSVPLSYPTGFPQPQIDGRDGWANYTEQSGYEAELAEILYYLEAHQIKNVIFLTADVHWPFAISYDPDRDGASDFFEFGTGPLSAITLPPVEVPDPSFNPTVLYAEGTFQGDLFNFGQIVIEEDGSLTYRVLDREGDELFSIGLTPEE